MKHNNTYSKILTVALIVVILAIVGVLGYLAYTAFAEKKMGDDAQQAAEEFEKTITGTGKKASSGNSTLNELNTTSNRNNKKYLEGYEILGTIEIPKTKLKCTILSEVTKRSIEIGVGKIYTTSGLNQPGTTVIYGHNYRNSLFFSKNKELTNGDKIYILDQTGTKLTYEVYNSFETTSTDTSFYTNTDTQGKAEIVLSTCTDDASTTDRRFIIQAREVD